MKFIFHTSGKPTEGESYTVPYTVITNSFLDEELDSTSIELNKIDRAAPFKPFTIVTMQASDSDVIRWMVATDNAVKDIPTGKWTHTVTLIEPTKWLERWMVGNKAVTQKISNYQDNDRNVPIVGQKLLASTFDVITGLPCSDANNLVLKAENAYTLPVEAYKDGIKIYLPAAFSNFNEEIQEYRYVLASEYVYILQNGNIVKEIIIGDTEDYGTKEVYPLYQEYIPEYGDITLVYVIKPKTQTPVKYGEYSTFAKVDVAQIFYADAAKNMITSAQNLLENEASIFELEESTLPTGNCPELTVTNATLREALDEIGKTFGAISRLDIEEDGDAFAYKIRFEKFCKDELAELPDFPGEVITSQSCEDYCTALDTTVDNLVRYSDGGTIADPAVDAFRTLRSEDASYRVTESSGEIFTAFPIERLDHLYVNISAIKKDKTETIDIAKYCFETSEYSMLSSYLASYPYSKAYALEYSIGSRGIRGLSFEMEDAISQLFQKPAIVNIINTEFGTTFSDLKTLDFTKILFRVEYVPTGTARLRMRKPWSLGKTESVLPFNQSAAKIDSASFGRSMFGNVLRMGNEQTSYTFTVPIDYVAPERGCRIGENGYIAEVKTEYAPASKKVTFVIVQGFNRLSAFVGVNQALRLFEISERTSLDRHIIVEDFCVIGKEPRSAEKASAATIGLKNKIRASFVGLREEDIAPYVVARAQGYSQGLALTPVLLPCLSYAVGNSLVFTFAFGDNFTAGRRIDPLDYAVGAEKEMFETETDVPYADAFGRIDYLDVSFLDGTGAGSIVGVGETEDKREADRAKKILSAANALPAIDNDRTQDRNTFVAFLKKPEPNESTAIVVNKDSREALKGVTYQLNFMEADGIKVSPNFVERLGIANRKLVKLYLAAWDGSINNLTNSFPLTANLHKIAGNTYDAGNGFRVEFDIDEESVSKSSWAVVDSNNVFCFGANESLKEGAFSIYFSFVHK